MSNVIQVLERLGRDPSTHFCTTRQIDARLAQAGIEPEVRRALIGGDQHTVETLLGAKRHMCCLVRSPSEDDDFFYDENIEDADDDVLGSANATIARTRPGSELRAL